ncbi:hypothetical protein OPV22_018046 [Ensete ventricosum]|uniref:Bromo domain-containing protein n=1 Tax=Ensete ventricosum TaxID=4639 RepID=A0AAV8PFI4_ENSVE|nr:hypothetical protein OPV22_018046 [Ensete ventricosum]
MGNTKPPVASKRRKKKKGRPSLLDLQRRSLRLQRLEQGEEDQQPSPNPDDDPRRPSSRLKPDAAAEAAAAAADDDEDEDGDDHSGRRRREKKLRLVLRLPNIPSTDTAASGSESDGRRAGKIGPAGSDAQTEGQNPVSKGMDLPQDSGPTTPLPDKKLLVFILDRLQKKDTYGVFAEPVDPEELPDYHDIIKHPMDFATIRKKLSGGAYANLEQFEKDVFLICSNAMQYNAPDTIYYRQARSIQELAKKNFENLRQESDDNEPESKPVRRGRPPSKNIQKKLGRPPVDRASSNFSSNATHSNAGDSGLWTSLSHDLSRKGLDKTSSSELPAKPYGLRIIESHSLIGDHKSERNEDNSGSAVKGFSIKYPKKPLVIDENRRITYSHPQVFGSTSESSVLTTFEGERKQLIPVGLYMEHAYARSLARFAAKLGPIGWEIAAKRIESVLPPGTKFGRGWVGDNEVPQPSQPPLLTRSPSRVSQPESTPTTSALASEHSPSGMLTEVCANTTPSTSSPLSSRVLDSGEVIARNHGSVFKPQSAVGGQGNWQKTPFHLNQAAAAMQPNMNGFNNPLGFNHPSQVGKSVITCASPESFSSEAMRTHSRALDMVARNSSQTTSSNFNIDKVTMVADPSTSSSSGSHLPDSGHDSQGTWRGLSINPKSASVPPDLNVGFQTPGSPVSGFLLDSQNPNLSLQL